MNGNRLGLLYLQGTVTNVNVADVKKDFQFIMLLMNTCFTKWNTLKTS